MLRGFDLTDYSWFNIRLGLDFITKKKKKKRDKVFKNEPNKICERQPFPNNILSVMSNSTVKVPSSMKFICNTSIISEHWLTLNFVGT